VQHVALPEMVKVAQKGPQPQQQPRQDQTRHRQMKRQEETKRRGRAIKLQCVWAVLVFEIESEIVLREFKLCSYMLSAYAKLH